MNEAIEKTYQKMRIFAKLFNMQITRFEQNNEDNIIRLYNNDKLVGDIKSINGYSYAFNIYPNFFEGTIKGNYDSYNGQFICFVRSEQQDLTGGIAIKESAEDKYQVSGCFSSRNKYKNKTLVSFNQSNAYFLIEKESKRATEGVSFTSSPTIIMLNHQRINENLLKYYSMFQFFDVPNKNELVFTMNIDGKYYNRYLPYAISKERELYDKLKATDLEIVKSNLNKTGKHLLKFLNSVKKDSNILTTNGEVISLYDTMANLCFPDVSDPLFIFTGANPQQQEEKGKVLKRI